VRRGPVRSRRACRFCRRGLDTGSVLSRHPTRL